MYVTLDGTEVESQRGAHLAGNGARVCVEAPLVGAGSKKVGKSMARIAHMELRLTLPRHCTFEVATDSEPRIVTRLSQGVKLEVLCKKSGQKTALS